MAVYLFVSFAASSPGLKMCGGTIGGVEWADGCGRGDPYPSGVEYWEREENCRRFQQMAILESQYGSGKLHA